MIDTSQIRATPISRANPLTKLAASLTITVALVLTVDIVSAATALALELLVLPFTGVPWRTLGRVLAPIALSAVLAGLVTTVIGVDSGATLVGTGVLTISEGSLRTGVAIVARVLAIAVPGVVLVVGTDPTDLADALAQRLRLPARFVLGGLAGLRLFGVLTNEWRTLAMARRARGLTDGGGILGSARVLAGQSFTLLVVSIRRGTRLAVAMEGRGFGAPVTRTWARPSTFAPRDAGVLVGAAVITATAVTASVLTGSWTFILG